MFRGAVLDGPLFGNNVTCDGPICRCAKIGRVNPRLPKDGESLTAQAVRYYEYQWDFTIEAWRLRS